jgi:autotransporter-associated beta strand protein
VGYSGTGSFTQSGGTHTVTALYLGTDAGASGTYNLSGGSLSVGGNEYVGIFGSGAFNQTGGTHTVSGNLYLATNAGSSGTYSLSGGSLSAGTITLNSGGTFTQSGGTLSISSDSDPGGGTLNINGGTLQASGGPHILGNDLKVGGDFALGGTNNFTLSGAVDLGGPTRTITLTNSGDTNLSGIISNGGLSIDNTGAGSLTLSGANTYTGTTTLNSGTLLAGNNEAFNATGAANLIIKGGTIGASAAGISITNPLTIGGDFNMGGGAGTTLEFTKTMNLTGFLLTHNGASDDTLKGNLTSTASGGITVTAGTLNLTGNNGGYIGTSTVTGGTLNLQGSGNYTGNNSVSGGILNMNSASAITYSGTNTVSGGTLNMSSAGSTYSGASTVTNATLNLSNGAYTGGLTLGANGIFNFTGGTFAPAGGANITTATGSTISIAAGLNLNIGAANTLTNNGTVNVNGTLTGNLTNNAGGLLDGIGTITGTFNNFGTVNPGNSPGTLYVGTYTSNAGATHVVEIASASSYDKLVATAAGGVTLNGGTLSPRLLGGYLPPVNQVFPNIISNTGGGAVTGAFTSIDETRIGNSRTLFWQAIYNPSSVDLKAAPNFTPPDLTLTSNQLSVGNMLNGVAPSATSGDMFEVLNAICALTTNSAVGSAYNEISPMKYSSLPTLTFGLTRMQFEAFKNRMATLRWESELSSGSPSAGGSGGGLFRGLSFGYDNKMLMAASTMAISDAGTPMSGRGVNQRWGIYVEPLFNWGNQSGVTNQVGYRSFSAGFTAGVDFRIMENLLVGLNLGYSNTDTSIGGTGGNININTIPFNAYGAFFKNGFYVNGALGYTHNSYDMQRNIAFGTINRTANASTGGNQFQLGVDGGYDVKVGNAIFGPMLSVQFATLETQAFTESNAGALNLKVASQSATSVQTGLGARASYRGKVGNVTVKPQVSVAWQHEYSDNTRGLNASLAQGSSNMTFNTISNPGKNFAMVNAGVSARFSKRFVANVGYTGEVGRSNAANHGVSAGIRFEF